MDGISAIDKGPTLAQIMMMARSMDVQRAMASTLLQAMPPVASPAGTPRVAATSSALDTYL